MIHMNMLKLSMPVTVVALPGILLGHGIGGRAGIVLATVCVLLLYGVATWCTESIILHLSGAYKGTPGDTPWLTELVAELAERAQLPMPTIATIDSPVPNAFTVSYPRERGVVVVTSSITQLLTRDELAAVVAHELAHIRQGDTHISAITTTVAGILMFPATVAQLRRVVLVLVTPLAALLVHLGVSRSRAYEADALGAALLGDPLPLASALEKIEWAAQQMRLDTNPALAPLYIVNPLNGQEPALWLFSTHPPTADRVARLRALSHEAYTAPSIHSRAQSALLWSE